MKPLGFAALLVILQAQRLPPAATVQQQVDVVGEPFVVLEAEKAWLGAEAFWPLATGGDPLTRRYALRAIGRLEDPANVPALLEIGRARDVVIVPAVAEAIVQSLYGFDPERDPGLIAAVSTWFLAITDLNRPESVPIVSPPLGQIRYGTLDQFHAAERRLVKIQERYESAPEKTPGFVWYR